MATYQGGFEVPAPPVRPRSRGLLLDVAEPLDLSHPLGDDHERGFDDPEDRAVGGVNFCGGNACVDVDGYPNLWCADEEDQTLPWAAEDYEFPDADSVAFGSFSVVTAEESPARFNAAWLRERANERLRARWSAQIARELLTGDLTGNPSLRSEANVVISQATDPAEVPFVIEDVLADYDGIAFVVHMDPATFTLLSDPWGYEQDDKEDAEDPNPLPFRTPTGHWVIGDAGYKPADGDEFAPDNFDSGAGNRWVYASGMPRTWMGPARELGADTARFDRTTNRQTFVVERSALVAFDPCVVVAVQVEVPTYDIAPIGS